MTKLEFVLTELTKSGQITATQHIAILSCCETIYEKMPPDWETQYGEWAIKGLQELMAKD